MQQLPPTQIVIPCCPLAGGLAIKHWPPTRRICMIQISRNIKQSKYNSGPSSKPKKAVSLVGFWYRQVDTTALAPKPSPCHYSIRTHRNHAPPYIMGQFTDPEHPIQLCSLEAFNPIHTNIIPNTIKISIPKMRPQRPLQGTQNPFHPFRCYFSNGTFYQPLHNHVIPD